MVYKIAKVQKGDLSMASTSRVTSGAESGRLGLLPRMPVRMEDSTIDGHVYATMIPSPAHASGG
jgi:hypothetical protein